MDAQAGLWVADLIEELAGLQPAEVAFVTDGREAGWLPTLRRLTADQAARPPAAGRPSVLAHSTHMRYHLANYLAHEQGERPVPDWAQSWLVPNIAESGWPAYVEGLRQEIDDLLAVLRAPAPWPEPRLSAAILLVTHLAYHLGALRQVVALVRTNDGP